MEKIAERSSADLTFPVSLDRISYPHLLSFLFSQICCLRSNVAGLRERECCCAGASARCDDHRITCDGTIVLKARARSCDDKRCKRQESGSSSWRTHSCALHVAADDESVAFEDNGEWLAVSGEFPYFTAGRFPRRYFPSSGRA